MDLLEKLDAVTIRSDTQISQKDREFCIAHQAAYDNARCSLAELLSIWEDMLKTQEALLEGTGQSNRIYISGDSSISVSKQNIKKTIFDMHKEFIKQIISHFTSTYHISLSEYSITLDLLPQKPVWRYGPEYDLELEKYEEEKAAFVLTYEQILDVILKEMGGRSFSEFAVFQIKDGCWEAAWRDGTPKYERDKCTVRLLSATNSEFEIYEGTKKIMKALSYFETQAVDWTPYELEPFLCYRGPRYNAFDFEELTKVSKIRLYKNGRVDIRFAEEAYAVQFVSEYLGTIPWKEAYR